jgi:hypothetical protein
MLIRKLYSNTFSVDYNEIISIYLIRTAGLVVERFQVSVQSTEASERACLRGQLQLVIFTRGVGVARIGDFECFLLWPIAFIRQYRHESLKNKNTSSSSILNTTNQCDKRGTNKRHTIVKLEVGRYALHQFYSRINYF